MRTLRENDKIKVKDSARDKTRLVLDDKSAEFLARRLLQEVQSEVEISREEKEEQPEPDEEEEQEESEGKFPLSNTPKHYSLKIRKSMISEWFKEKREEEGKFFDATLYEISEKVFGYSASGTSDPEYQALYTAVRKAPEIRQSSNEEETNGKPLNKYTLSNKVKITNTS